MSREQAALNEENVRKIREKWGWEQWERTLPITQGGHPHLSATELNQNRTYCLLSCAKSGVTPQQVWDFVAQWRQKAGGTHLSATTFPPVQALRDASLHFKKPGKLVLKISPARYRAAMGTRLRQNLEVQVVDLTEHDSLPPHSDASDVGQAYWAAINTFPNPATAGEAVKQHTKEHSAQSGSMQVEDVKDNTQSILTTQAENPASFERTSQAHSTPDSVISGRAPAAGIFSVTSGFNKLFSEDELITAELTAARKKDAEFDERVDHAKHELIHQLQECEDEETSIRESLYALWHYSLHDQIAFKKLRKEIESLQRSNGSRRGVSDSHHLSRNAMISELGKMNMQFEALQHRQQKRKALPDVHENDDAMAGNSNPRKRRIDDIRSAFRRLENDLVGENTPTTQVNHPLPEHALSTQTSQYPEWPFYNSELTAGSHGGKAHNMSLSAILSHEINDRRSGSDSTPHPSSSNSTIED